MTSLDVETREILEILSKFNDRTLRQISVLLGNKNMLGLYDELWRLEKKGFICHKTKMTRLDLYEITPEGRRLLQGNTTLRSNSKSKNGDQKEND